MEALAKLEEERGNPGYQSEKCGNPSYPSKECENLSYQSEEKENGGTGKAQEKEGEKKTHSPSITRGASNEMCTFLVLNISSLQLIPVSIIAYRSQYGSLNPAAVIGPGLLATAISTAVAVLFCKVMQISKRK